MSQVISYKVKPAFAAENEELIRAVFGELHQVNPDGFQYESFVQDDGVSFIHVVRDVEGGRPSPLVDLSAFQRFQQGMADRCEVAPVREIGSYDHAQDQSPLERVEA